MEKEKLNLSNITITIEKGIKSNILEINKILESDLKRFKNFFPSKEERDEYINWSQSKNLKKKKKFPKIININFRKFYDRGYINFRNEININSEIYLIIYANFDFNFSKFETRDNYQKYISRKFLDYYYENINK